MNLKLKKYKSLPVYFEEDHQGVDCNSLLKSIAPDILSFNKDNEEVVDFDYLRSNHVINAVSHFIAEAIIPYFEFESPDELLLTALPISEEFTD